MFHNILHSAVYRLFHAGYHSVVDVVWFVLLLRARSIAARSTDARWRSHAGWLTLSLVSCCGSLFYRAIVNLHSFFGIGLPAGLILFDDGVLMAANLFGIGGLVGLIRLLRQQVPVLSLTHRPVEQWPAPEGATAETDTAPANPWSARP